MGEEEDLEVAVAAETAEKSTALSNGGKLPSRRKVSWKSSDRDAALAQFENDKKLSFIRAWEDGEKAKAENKAQKKKAAITVWENSKRADLEAELKKVEQNYENKKAAYAEKIKNKIAMIHKAAVEKRAEVDAKCGEELLKAEESAAKYKAKGQPPKKAFSCFGA